MVMTSWDRLHGLFRRLLPPDCHHLGRTLLSVAQDSEGVTANFADGSSARDRIYEMGDDALIESLAKAVSGTLGGNTGIAPRIFLKKLVTDILDRIELYETFDPRKDYRLTIRQDELSAEERNLMPASSVEDIRLEL